MNENSELSREFHEFEIRAPIQDHGLAIEQEPFALVHDPPPPG
jgi:hypothetical protein